jgi:NAD(P)-dependent dehydrogenase (short-subunit alcohol dehydrogenase family)
VAKSRSICSTGTFVASNEQALVDGNLGESAVAAKVVQTAITKFGSIDALVNNAGIFFAKSFTAFKAEDFETLSTVNLKGFLYVTQGSVKQIFTQKRGGSVISITSPQVVNPIAGILGSVPMISKGGIEAVTRSLANEYAEQHIRFNAVALGIVDTPTHANAPKDFLKTLSPMHTIGSVSDVVDAVVYLTEPLNFTGGVMHVDGGAHQGRWRIERGRISASPKHRLTGSGMPPYYANSLSVAVCSLRGGSPNGAVRGRHSNRANVTSTFNHSLLHSRNNGPDFHACAGNLTVSVSGYRRRPARCRSARILRARFAAFCTVI